MADPISTAGAAVVAGAVTIAGVTLGLQYDVLAAGLAGGLWSLTFQDPAPIWKRGVSALTAAIVAGYLAPVVATVGASFAAQYAPVVTPAILRLPVALAVGFLTHEIGPFALRFLRKKENEVA